MRWVSPDSGFTTTAYPLAVAARPVMPASAESTSHTTLPGTAEATGAGDGVAQAADTGKLAVPRTRPSTPLAANALRRIGPVSQSDPQTWCPAGDELCRLPSVSGGDGVDRVRAQLGGQRLGHPYPQPPALLAVLRTQDLATPVYPGDQVAPVVRDQGGHLDRRPGQPRLDRRHDRRDPGAGTRRAEHGVRPLALEPQQGLLAGRVDLVDHQQLGQRIRAHLGEHLADRADLLLRGGVRPVHHA